MTRLDSVPLFDLLTSSENILIAGAGGGFDLFTGLPIYFRLVENGHNVWLANYSFSDLEVNSVSPMQEVTADTTPLEYFPEKYLCEWLDANIDHCSTIYSFGRTGVQPMQNAYQELVDELGLDTIILVDGGTDSLMRGDEEGIGTPTEDLTSIAAVHGLDVETKLLVCLGFGVDTFHDICHHYFLEAVAALTKSGHFLGAFSLMPDSEEASLMRQALDYVHEKMPVHPSIVNSSILAACQGEFGDYHATSRTAGSELYINPLMSLYWAFRLEGVADRCLYFQHILESQTIADVGNAINRFRQSRRLRPWKNMPM
ncbi:MAG: DUF1152 domain-containing protein [Candidatus Eremiobacteraeota bacterium]|nr:DUF1152 domain-containing protein [Candidatus Eremiobacteraeota bacterium]